MGGKGLCRKREGFRRGAGWGRRSPRVRDARSREIPSEAVSVEGCRHEAGGLLRRLVEVRSALRVGLRGIVWGRATKLSQMTPWAQSPPCPIRRPLPRADDDFSPSDTHIVRTSSGRPRKTKTFHDSSVSQEGFSDSKENDGMGTQRNHANTFLTSSSSSPMASRCLPTLESLSCSFSFRSRYFWPCSRLASTRRAAGVTNSATGGKGRSSVSDEVKHFHRALAREGTKEREKRYSPAFSKTVAPENEPSKTLMGVKTNRGPISTSVVTGGPLGVIGSFSTIWKFRNQILSSRREKVRMWSMKGLVRREVLGTENICSWFR